MGARSRAAPEGVPDADKHSADGIEDSGNAVAYGSHDFPYESEHLSGALVDR